MTKTSGTQKKVTVKVEAETTRVDRLARALRGLVLPVLLLSAWELVVRFHLVNTRILVEPSRVFASLVETWRDGELTADVAGSLKRDLQGFALGATAGLVIGSLLGLSRLGDRVFGPTLNAAKQVAVFAWLPLISVWFGTEEPAKVVFVALAAFYPVVANTYEGVRSVERPHLQVASVFGFSRVQTFRKVVLPAALPSIFAGLELGLVYAWLGTLGAEFLLAAAPGVGNLMSDGREQFAMDRVLLGVILAGLLGSVLNVLAGLVERRALRWRPRDV